MKKLTMVEQHKLWARLVNVQKELMEISKPIEPMDDELFAICKGLFDTREHLLDVITKVHNYNRGEE